MPICYTGHTRLSWAVSSLPGSQVCCTWGLEAPSSPATLQPRAVWPLSSSHCNLSRKSPVKFMLVLPFMVPFIMALSEMTDVISGRPTLTGEKMLHCSHGWPLSRCRLDSWLKLWKLGVHSDMGLGLSLCAVPLLQFGSQRSEEVESECQSKVVAWMMIKIVNDKEGTNSRHRRWEEFVPNR